MDSYQLQCTNMEIPFLFFIDAVHNRAMWFLLGVGKYTPNDTVSDEMAWKPTSARYASGKVYICTGQNFQPWMIVRF